MKLISYYQVNAFLRRQRSHQKNEATQNDSTFKIDKNNNNEKILADKNEDASSSNDKIVTYPNNLNHKGDYHLFKKEKNLELNIMIFFLRFILFHCRSDTMLRNKLPKNKEH